MNFSKSNIQEHVNTDRISSDTKLQTVGYFLDRSNSASQEDTALAVIILHATKPEGKSVQVSNQQGNKKFKTNYNQKFNYNRYFICGDAMNPHHCFAIATGSLAETALLLKQATTESFLGMTFYLVEPPPVKKTQGATMTVFNCDDHQLLPLKSGNPAILTRETPIAMPPNANDIFYFIRENEELVFTKAHVPANLTCSGFQCDRQKKQDCLCMTTPFGSSLVYEFDIQFNVEMKIFKTEKYVTRFRSLRLTSVFFEDFITHAASTNLDDERDLQVERRKQMKEIYEFINGNGGWRMIGWCKRGEISVEGETEKIENDEINIHLTYVYPSNHDILRDEDFRKLVIKSRSNQQGTAAQIHRE